MIKLSIGDQDFGHGFGLFTTTSKMVMVMALDNTCMVATKSCFREAMPRSIADYSWSIVSDPQKAEQIRKQSGAIISSDPDLALRHHWDT